MAGILALVTARGGSKGLPRKNILNVGGRPLIAWTIDAAKKSARLLARKSPDWSISRIVASTDSARIRDICLEHGAEAPFLRPAHLAMDDTPHVDTVRHALEWLEEEENYQPDWVLLLQPTSPLRTPEDICMAIDLAQTRRPPAVISVCETHAHPYLTRKIEKSGRLQMFVECPLKYARRQDLPEAYAINGAVYLIQRKILIEQNTFEPYGTIAQVMPPERSLQVDSTWELHMVDLILRDRGHCGPTAEAVEQPCVVKRVETSRSPELLRVSEK